MSYSCSDFADDVLEKMVLAGLVRADDIPSDNPGRQCELVIAGLDRLIAVKDSTAELVAAVKAGAADKISLGVVAAEERVGRLLPGFMVCEDYGHCFDGDDCSTTRWAMDLNDGTLVFAQVKVQETWRHLDRDEMADLLEDIHDTNAVRESPDDHGAAFVDVLPDWARG